MAVAPLPNNKIPMVDTEDRPTLAWWKWFQQLQAVTGATGPQGPQGETGPTGPAGESVDSLDLLAVDYAAPTQGLDPYVVVQAFVEEGTQYLGPYTVTNLPHYAPVGTRAYVTNANGPTFLGTLTGGGSVVCPVFYNGSAWIAG